MRETYLPDALRVGPWCFCVHVEQRVAPRWTSDYPEVRAGDVEYRVVIEIHFEDLSEDGENGMEGKLATSWLGSLDKAMAQAKLFRTIVLSWTGEDDEEARAVDDYDRHCEAQVDDVFDGLVNGAVENFRLATGEVPA